MFFKLPSTFQFPLNAPIAMPVSVNHHRENSDWKSLTISCLVSFTSALFTQLTLFLLLFFFPTSSFFILFPLSGVLILFVIGLGKCCKRVVGVKASAPAFVFFTVFFIWAVYIYAVRRVLSSLENILFNAEITMVMYGLYRIMGSDPGLVTGDIARHDVNVETPLAEIKAHGENESQDDEGSAIRGRVRYCRHCKKYILGFDHHCPAFGNCIGQKNHFFFIWLLIGFLISEVSYVTFSIRFNTNSQTLMEAGKEGDHSIYLVLSTMLFSAIQVLWQVFFLMWHVHCACFNIKTDEWVNWRKYPEFQKKAAPQAGEFQSVPLFTNPYDRGIIINLKEFITGKG